MERDHCYFSVCLDRKLPSYFTYFLAVKLCHVNSKKIKNFILQSDNLLELPVLIKLNKI